MADHPLPDRPQPGIFQVALVVLAVVAVVIGASVVSGVLPEPIRRTIAEGPVLIAVLIVGTGWLLWRISRGRPFGG